MKKYLFNPRLFTTISIFSMILSGSLLLGSFVSVVRAQDSIEFNIGEEAINQNLPGTANASADNPQAGFYSLIGTLASFMMTVGAIMVLIYLLWGAIEWISSGGDSGKLEKARQRISTAIIGLIVLSAAIALFMVVQQFLGICVLPFFGACTPDAVGPPTGGTPSTPGAPGIPPVPPGGPIPI